jgi:hypothetical protein
MQEPDKAHDSGAIREDGLDRGHEDEKPLELPPKDAHSPGHRPMASATGSSAA